MTNVFRPAGLRLILFIELWERFSYYGMRSLLTLYMVCQLQLPVARAAQIYGLYTGLAYLLPIVGGLLADRVLGERRAIVAGGTLMAAGHFAMVLPGWPPFCAALALIVLGTGLFKSNTAALLGKLYDGGRPGRRAAFAWFYLTVNLGGFLAPLICGALAAQGHWHRGFGVAGMGMLLGLVVWLPLAHRFGAVGAPPKAALSASASAGQTRLTPHERDRLWALVLLALLANVGLWAAIGQHGSSVALFADRSIRRHLPFCHADVPASSLQALNPLFILLGVPLLGALGRAIDRRGLRPSPPVQMALGLLFVSAAFAVLAGAGHLSDGGAKVHIGFLVLAVLLNTIGELCVSPLGLALVSQLAPARLSSLAMGLWYASMALANGISGQFAGLYETLPKGQLFAIPAVWTALSALALFVFRQPLLALLHLHEPDRAAAPSR